MTDEPDIVKLLKVQEKQGKLKCLSKEKEKTDEDIYKNNSNGLLQVIKDTSEAKEKDDIIIDIEEKYKKIFENYSVAITLADKNERIISWNNYAETLFNMDEKDLFMLPVQSLYPTEEWNKIRKENIRQKGMKHLLETKMICKNKGTFDVEISLSVLKGKEGKICGSVGIIKDITKLKNAQRKLIESENKYKTIFENSAIAITLTDENEKIISWNNYAEKLLGMGQKELYLKPVKTLYPPEEWNKIRKENIRQKGMQHHLETKIICNNNKLLQVDISLSVLKDCKGKIIGSIGVFKDITEQKIIEKELQYKHNLLQSLLDNIPDSIYFKDINNKFIKVNKSKADRLNTTPEIMKGKTDFDFFPENIAKNSFEDDKKVLETGKPIINKIEKRENENGRERWILTTKVPRYDQNGNIIGTMGISRDITKLKESEKRYRNFFETATDPIVILDNNGYYADINSQVTKLLGYNKNDLIGKRFDEKNLFNKDGSGIILKEFIDKKERENKTKNDLVLLTKRGEGIPADIKAYPLYENNEKIGDFVIFKDLREKYKRQKMERELIESENRFKSIFNETSDILLYIEKNIILDINKAALKIGNLKKEDVIGKKFSNLKDIFFQENIDKHIKSIEEAVSGIRVPDYESNLSTINGDSYKFLFSVDCIREEKDLKGIILRGKDITQRQKAWDELVRLEERYRVLAETSADGVLTIDELGHLTYVNPSFEKLCGRRKSQILATLFRDYLSEDSVYFFQQVFIDTRKKDERIENIELELNHENGDIIPIEVNIAPYKKDDKFAGMVCTIRDITNRRKVEDELKKSERLKTEFMNIAAHELKSPVTPIKGYLDLILSDKDTSDKIKKWAKVSLRNAEKLLNLVNEILDVSRLDTDTMKFEMEKINIKELLNEIVEDMKSAAENKKLKLVTEIAKDLPNIMGDKNRLSQVLKNLFVNAIKFTDDGSITVQAEKEADHIFVSIKDTGIGISKKELNKIFNKFYQAYTGDDRKNEGTGLGLFICREIIRKHNGEIWVESDLGKGSQFIIKIPYIHKMIIDL